MPTPATPVLVNPASGSTLVDPLRPVLQIGPFVSGGSFGTAELQLGARQVEADEAGGVYTFLNEGYLLTPNSGQQQHMASSTGSKAVSVVNFHGSGSALTHRVASVHVHMRAMAAWPAGQAPGAAAIRWILTYGGTRFHGGFYLDTTRQWSGGTAAATLFSKEVTAGFAALLGRSVFTVADLIAMLNQGTSSDATLKLQVHANAHTVEQSFVTTWYASQVRLAIYYWPTPPDRQGAVQFRVSPNSNMSSPNYDTGKVAGSHTVHALGDYRGSVRQPLEGNKLYYWDSQVWTESDVPSALPTPASFRTMPMGAARLAHDSARRMARVVRLITLGFPRHLDASAWRLHDATRADAFVYKAAFSRIVEGCPYLWLSGAVKENSRLVVYTQRYRYEDMVGRSEIFFDEAAGTVYVCTSDGRSPANTGALGIGIELNLGIANATGIMCGPSDAYQALPILIKAPTWERSLSDVSRGVRATPQGSIVARNEESDLSLDRPERFWDRLLALGHGGHTRGLLAAGCRFEDAAVGDHAGGPVPYEERLILGVGTFTWDDPLHEGPIVRFKASPEPLAADRRKLGTERFTTSEHPALRARDVGTVKAEVEGANHIDIECAVLTATAGLAAGLPRLQPGRKVSSGTRIRYNGIPYGSADGSARGPQGQANYWWIHSSATNQITLLRYPSGFAWTQDKIDATWMADVEGNGEFLGSRLVAAADFARYLLWRLGVPAADVPTASFDRVRNLVPPDTLAYVLRDGREILDVLAAVERSGYFHVATLPDGTYYAVPRGASGYPAGAILLREQQGEILARVTRMDSSLLAERTVVSLWGYPATGVAEHEIAIVSQEARPLWGAKDEQKIETFHRLPTGVAALKDRLQGELEAPGTVTTIRTPGLLGWLGRLGGTAIVTADDALAPSGRWQGEDFRVERMRLVDGPDEELGPDVELDCKWRQTAALEGVFG